MKILRPSPKLLITILIVGIIIVWFLFFKISSKSDKKEYHVTHTEVLEKIEAIGRLELVRMQVQDIMEHEKTRQWLPNARSLLIIKGEAVGCIDLMKLKEENLYINKDTINIILPEPELCYSKINHSQSKVFDTQNHFFSGAQIIDEAYKEAERHLRITVLNAGILDETKENAHRFFQPFFETLGFKEVRISFEGGWNNAKPN